MLNHKKAIFTLMLAATSLGLSAQSFKFDFTGRKPAAGFTAVSSDSLFTEQRGFGYDLHPAWDGKSNAPFFFSVNVPDGNYRVTVTLGSKKSVGVTTVRAESRRLFLEDVATKKGELVTRTFIVNKRNPVIDRKDGKDNRVRLKKRELHKLNWDDKLTFEFNGDAPRLARIVIERDEQVPTMYLCGNSTVVDNDNEPWASWGQMITRFMGPEVAISNHAESGLSANTFVGGLRLEKIKTTLRKGDYLFFEFGHNDQKQKGPGKGAYYEFAFYLKQFIDVAREVGATPVLVTPTRRRQFDEQGHVRDTHQDFPAAIREIAARENVALIDLQEMTKVMIEALGKEASTRLFVHYPAGTYPGQTVDFKDNTHFNPYGAYEVAKCVVEGIKAAKLPIASAICPDFQPFDPAHPDAFESFHWNDSPFTEIEKPDGN